MKKQPFCNFFLAGLSLTDFGLAIPSPFTSLELSNSEIQSMTSFTLTCNVGGDNKKKVNVAAFEALLYSAAQVSTNSGSSGIPVSFSFGWLDDRGNVVEHLSYQGFTLKFKVATTGLFMTYTLTGFASLALQSSLPVLNIPQLSGIVQPSAVVEALAKGVKATNYYQLDIDHNDAPTLIQHGPLCTSFNSYVRGSYTGEDDFENFPGLLKLSKSYSGSRDAAGINPRYKSLSSILNNRISTPVSQFLVKSLTDETPQCSSFSFWIDEPTMTRPGIIHYKSNAVLMNNQVSDALRYGTSDTNILSLSGSYDGVAFNMTDMRFSDIGFALDASGNEISQDAKVINSWSSSLADVYQTANIINDLNALASQFSGDFSITIAGSLKQYTVAQPVSLLVMSGNTLSPISGIYNIVSVSHKISNTFVTVLKVQRLVMSSANQVAAGQGIIIRGSQSYPDSAYSKTSNIKSAYKVDFGDMYPTFEHMYAV